MKIKSRWLITGAIAVVAALLVANNPSMTVIEATTERVVIETSGFCKYDLWLYHAPLSCNDLLGSRVISATYFSKGTFYWDAIGWNPPETGDWVCGYWDCGERSGEISAVVTEKYRVYLPLVLSHAR